MSFKNLINVSIAIQTFRKGDGIECAYKIGWRESTQLFGVCDHLKSLRGFGFLFAERYAKHIRPDSLQVHKARFGNAVGFPLAYRWHLDFANPCDFRSATEFFNDFCMVHGCNDKARLTLMQGKTNNIFGSLKPCL